ncbi:hypothetical protein GCM10027280_62370 [Micromonospora polyrhachis]|uniref:Uncharacterized protein n=1 Tax=Micromonospora polyrhachis TaxID=1282883 RepID=A0A7W7WR61_9ACTN|nr:hypothetical protein [Micromonospora polyrhachis]
MLVHRPDLPGLAIVRAELDGAHGVEQAAPIGGKDLQPGPPLLRIKTQPGRSGGGVPGPQQIGAVANGISSARLRSGRSGTVTLPTPCPIGVPTTLNASAGTLTVSPAVR